jgi:transposase-like protein
MFGERAGAEVWRRRVAEQRRGGLSIAAYCLRHGLSEASFYYWKRKFRDEPAADRSPARATFLPIAVAETNGSIEIVRPDGLVLRVPCDERVLRMTLGVLESPAC